MSVIPAPGDIYNNPPFPAEFNGMGVANGILMTCYAVTAGPNRNLYWIYDDMKSSDAGIQTIVSRGACFETRDSIAVSQRRTALIDTCATCQRTIGAHMTATQATILSMNTRTKNSSVNHTVKMTNIAALACPSLLL